MNAPRFALLALAAAVLTLTAVAAPAQAAAGTWGPPLTLSPAGAEAFSPQLVVLGNGTIVVTWYSDNGVHNVVQTTRSTDAGATWSAPVTLSTPGLNAIAPHIAAADAGPITVTWIANGFVQTATSTDSGVTWGAPLDHSAAGQSANDARVVVAPDGTFVVTWAVFDGAAWIVQATTSTNAGVTWSAPVDLSAASDNIASTVAVAADDGTIFATWTFYDGVSQVVQVTRSTDDGATWSAPSYLSAPGRDAYNPRLAVSPDGTVTATWQRYGVTYSIVQTSRSIDGGTTWAPPVDLTVAGADAYNARVAVAGDGTIAVVWERGDGSVRLVQARTSTDAGVTWSATVDLSAAGFYSDNPQLVVGADGTFTAAWERDVASTSVVEVATLTAAGATWSAPQQLSPGSGLVYEIQLAVAANGAVTAVWQHDDGAGNNAVQASTLAVAAAAVPGLASGGSNAVPIGLVGAVLLALGAVLVLRSRGVTSDTVDLWP